MNKRISVLNRMLIVVVALLTVGCDTLHFDQYVVKNASAGDQQAIQQVVESAARETGLQDKTANSKVANTVLFYVEPVPHSPVTLRMRLVAQDAVIDLSCFHPGWRGPAIYTVIESRLTPALSKEFGPRLTMPDYPAKRAVGICGVNYHRENMVFHTLTVGYWVTTR